jgi:hypothetical protein
LGTHMKRRGLRRMNYPKTVIYLLITYLLTHSLTPWSRVLLEKLTGLQPVKKFPAFYGTRRFITAYTSARPPVPILSQFNPVHTPTCYFLKIHLIQAPNIPGTKSHVPLSLLWSYQSTSPGPRLCEYFVTNYVFTVKSC